MKRKASGATCKFGESWKEPAPSEGAGASADAMITLLQRAAHPGLAYGQIQEHLLDAYAEYCDSAADRAAVLQIVQGSLRNLGLYPAEPVARTPEKPTP